MGQLEGAPTKTHVALDLRRLLKFLHLACKSVVPPRHTKCSCVLLGTGGASRWVRWAVAHPEIWSRKRDLTYAAAWLGSNWRA
jgi:hypothetical protein